MVLKIPDPAISTSQKVEKALQQAKIYMTVGSSKKATKYVDKAPQLDPSNAEAKSLSPKIRSS